MGLVARPRSPRCNLMFWSTLSVPACAFWFLDSEVFSRLAFVEECTQESRQWINLVGKQEKGFWVTASGRPSARASCKQRWRNCAVLWLPHRRDTPLDTDKWITFAQSVGEEALCAAAHNCWHWDLAVCVAAVCCFALTFRSVVGGKGLDYDGTALISYQHRPLFCYEGSSLVPRKIYTF